MIVKTRLNQKFFLILAEIMEARKKHKYNQVFQGMTTRQRGYIYPHSDISMRDTLAGPIYRPNSYRFLIVTESE